MNATVRSMVALHDPPTEVVDCVRKQLRYTNPAYVRQILYGNKFAAKPAKFIKGYIEEPEKKIVWVPRAWFYSTIYGVHELTAKLDTIEKPATFPEPLLSPLPDQMIALTDALDLVNANDAIKVPTDSYFVLPPGGGKTILGMLLIACCKQKTLVVVPTNEIEDAWMKDAQKVYGPNAHGLIGHIRGKKCDTSRPITIGSIQTVMDLPVHLWADQFGMVLFDEMHRLGAEVFANTVKRCRAHLRFGLTATDFRRDGRFVSVRWHLGQPCFRSEKRDNTVPLIYVAVRTPHGIASEKANDLYTFNDLLASLEKNEDRTGGIAWLADSILKNHSGDVLIVSPRTDHLHAIARRLEALGQLSFCIITGSVQGKQRKQLFSDVLAGIYRITLATTSIMSEGASNPRWHHVINTLPFSDPKTAIQLSGRPLRKDPNNAKKTFGMFWDIVDTNPMCRAMYRNRWKAMKRFLKETRVVALNGAPPFTLMDVTK